MIEKSYCPTNLFHVSNTSKFCLQFYYKILLQLKIAKKCKIANFKSFWQNKPLHINEISK
jgi:hypothetical protein